LPGNGQIRAFTGTNSNEQYIMVGSGRVGYRITVYHSSNPTWTSSATSVPTDYVRVGGLETGGGGGGGEDIDGNVEPLTTTTTTLPPPE